MVLAPRSRGRRGALGDRFAEARRTRTGAQFEIHEARDLVLDREVTVKTPVEVRARWHGDVLRREGRILRAVGPDPHIVALLDEVVLDDGRPALVLARTAGSVAAAVPAGGRLPLPQAVALGIKLSRALEATHAAGFVHCSVRPGTVRLDADAEPMLAGFEEAVALAGDEPRFPLHVTTGHTAPELLEGADPHPGQRRLRPGRHPVRAGRGAGGIPRVRRRVPRDDHRPGAERDRPPDRRPGVPLEVSDLLTWAMAPDPAKRPPSPAWLGEELSRLERQRELAAHAAVPALIDGHTVDGCSPPTSRVSSRSLPPPSRPTARNAVVAATRPELGDDSYRSSLWLVPVDGTRPPRRLTHGTRDTAPRYSPDGAVDRLPAGRGRRLAAAAPAADRRRRPPPAHRPAGRRRRRRLGARLHPAGVRRPRARAGPLRPGREGHAGQGAAAADHRAAVPQRRRRLRDRPPPAPVRHRRDRRRLRRHPDHPRRPGRRRGRLAPGQRPAGLRVAPARGPRARPVHRRVHLPARRQRPAAAHRHHAPAGAAGLDAGRHGARGHRRPRRAAPTGWPATRGSGGSTRRPRTPPRPG